MNYTRGITDMVLCRVSADMRGEALRRILPALDNFDLIDMAARETTPVDILEVLAEHPAAKVRHVVALNLECPLDLLEQLSADKAKTVAAAAARHLLWRQISAPDASVPEYSRGRAAQLETLFDRDHPWTLLDGNYDVLIRMMQDDQWSGDARFVRWFYQLAVLIPEDLVRTMEVSTLTKALLSSLHRVDVDAGLAWLWEVFSAEELFLVLQEHENLIEPVLERELGKKWATMSLDVKDDLLPVGWVRVALSKCSDEVILAALDSDFEILVQLAALQARSRKHLAPKIIRKLARQWEKEEYLYWDLTSALDDEYLLDLPLEAVVSYYNYNGRAIERAREVLAAKVAEVTQERPASWDVLVAIGDNYEGTGRDLLAALRSL